ncbi:DUF6230 family protein [Streptomyces sp. ACA25]|uniref:DUF6230 family protein n=1 Tax=Streptomyces sp. ACA25 TaxID=3022596 RepID=UPI002306F9E7|nr:DUF6230 family protein [Streptomyces sp. ACA25]MDB1087664.1 DUF6230 family protein [Streptomyces sp. ACA25]
MESQARGGTRWKRFGVVMVPSVAASAAIGVALAQGALAASFAVSGQQFKVTTERLEGTGFVQYGALDVKHDDELVPVAVSAFNSATINKLCQSVVVPTPIGDVTVKLGAGDNPAKPVKAKNLFIDITDLNADATFTNIDIGVSVDHSSKGPTPKSGEHRVPGSFAQQADKAVLTGVKQTAWATSAGTFELNGLKMKVHKGKNECY